MYFQKGYLKKMSNVKVSVIIPVYNVEKYLRECLDSVINQTFKDIEIICVNDGSTDNSLKILKEYEQRDERIVLISQSNKGVSSARNVALECAKGEYVCFMDPDDTVELDLVEKCYKEIIKNDDDIVVFGMNIIKNGIKKVRSDMTLLEENAFYTDNIDVIFGLSHNVCNKIFKRDFIEKYKIRFIENIKTLEDGIFCIRCILNNAKIRLFPKVFYNYVIDREGSATNNKEDVVNNDIQAFYAFENICALKDLDDEIFFVIIKKFIMGLLFYYEDEKYRIIYRPKIRKFLNYLEKTYGKKRLYNLKIYKKCKSEMGFGGFLRFIFSIYNNKEEKCKVVKILGLKIKFKRK